MKANINLSKKLFNKVYLKHDLLNNQDRYLVLMGGGGSGKSVFASQKIIYRMLSERGHRFLVLRKVQKTLRESVFMEFKRTIINWKLGKLFTIPKGSSGDLYIKCVNGNEILFAGLDDVEKLKSISGITGIWIEEASEIEPEDYRQLDIRLRGKTAHYKQMIISFNPISVTHWLKSEFFDHEKEGAFTLHTTYKDNKFLDEENIKVLEGFKHTDPYFYAVYALGEWGVLGDTVFNAQAVSERLALIKQYSKVVKRGSFVYEYKNEQIMDKSIKFVEDEKGPLIIYEEPIKNTPYVIGGDTAEGGKDWSVGQVRNNLTWNQAAVWRGHLDTDLYAKQMYCLGRYYNNALIGIEVNFDSHPNKELQRLRYPKIYVREVPDTYTGGFQKKFGFLTNRVTRPLIIANYVALARESMDLFNDLATLEEMLTFTRDENGKPTALEGKHDDTILADAICLEIRGQQGMNITQRQLDLSKLPADMREDYEKASPDMKKYLAEKWKLYK